MFEHLVHRWLKMQKRSDQKRLTLVENTAPIGLTWGDGKDAEKRAVYTSTFMFVYTEKKRSDIL